MSLVFTLLLGVILGCVVTTLIHSLTVSCVQCHGSASRSLVGVDKFSSIYTSSNRINVRQLGMAGETSCASLRLQMETVNTASPTTNRRRRRNVDNNGTVS